MLQNIRDRSQGWFSTVIIGIICLTFVLWGAHSFIGSGTSHRDAINIDGVGISQTQIDAAYERLRHQQQLQLGGAFTPSPDLEKQLKQQALNQIISTHILSKAARDEGLEFTLAQAVALVESVPAFQENGHFSMQRFQQMLQNILYTEQGFFDNLRTAMLINEVRVGVNNSAFALPYEVDTAIQLVNQKRNFSYLIIPASKFLAQVKPTETAISDYYQQHQAQFKTPEQISLEYVTLNLDDFKKAIRVSDAELKQYYQDNVNSYTTPQRWQVAQILVHLPSTATSEQIKQAQTRANDLAKRANEPNADFTKLAQEFSDDFVTAKNGGQLGWISAEQLDPKLAIELANKKTTGVLTAPIQTKQGFAIIKVLGYADAKVSPFNEVRSRLEQNLLQQKAEQQYAEASEKLSNAAFASNDSLNTPAKMLNLPIKATQLFTADGKGSQQDQALLNNPKILTTAFSNDVLKSGNNSALIELDSGHAIILRVKQHQEAAVKPLITVKPLIVEQLKNSMAQQQAQQLGTSMLAKIRQNISANALAKQEKLSWVNKTNVGRYEAKVNPEILRTAFHLTAPTANKVSSIGLQLQNGDYALLLLTSVNAGVINNQDITQQRIFNSQIANSLGQLDYALYVQGLFHRAKIDKAQD